MMNQSSGPRRIDKLLTGKPIQVDGYTVQPVAHLTGFTGFGGGENGGGGGGWLTLRPHEVIVHSGGSDDQHVALLDPTKVAVRTMMMVAMAVAAVSWLLAFVAWLARAKRSDNE